MRKPSKLGYCTTCNAKIFVFDANGKPFKRRSNYNEAIVQLSDGSTARLALCDSCMKEGFCAEEAMLNSIDGMREDTEKKQWGQNFKDWFLGQYENVRITDVLNASKFNWQSEKMVASENLPEVANMQSDESEPEKPQITLEILKEFVNGNSNETVNPA